LPKLVKNPRFFSVFPPLRPEYPVVSPLRAACAGISSPFQVFLGSPSTTLALCSLLSLQLLRNWATRDTIGQKLVFSVSPTVRPDSTVFPACAMLVSPFRVRFRCSQGLHQIPRHCASFYPFYCGKILQLVTTLVQTLVFVQCFPRMRPESHVLRACAMIVSPFRVRFRCS
jgi:hypothetical protein